MFGGSDLTFFDLKGACDGIAAAVINEGRPERSGGGLVTSLDVVPSIDTVYLPKPHNSLGVALTGPCMVAVPFRSMSSSL